MPGVGYTSRSREAVRLTTFVTGAPRAASHAHRVNEEAVIARARTGDQQAFAQLIGRYKHMVYTTVHRVLRNREEAEEATQDAFVKVYQHLAGYQGDSKFSTWLFSIAYRTAISRLRARKDAGLALDDLAGREPAHDAPDGTGRSDRQRALDKALRSLPPEDAALVGFFYLEELSVEEIVTATGLSASNVKVKLFRIRKRLFELLHQQLKEETWTLLAD